MAQAEIVVPPPAAPHMSLGLRLNLSAMMFLQFAIWGAWFVVLGNYTKAMGFSEKDIGSIFATMSLGAIISPIFVGQIADRYFSSERLMALLHLVGAGLLFWMAQVTEPVSFYSIALLYALVYSPTLALSNSIAFSHIPNATRDFPGIRVLGTIGWIVAGLLVTMLLQLYANPPGVSADQAPAFSIMFGGMRVTLPLFLSAIFSLILGILSFGLPHTPPLGKAGDVIPFLRALGLMKEPSFAVFYGVSFVITIVLAFYYSFTGLYLEKGQGVPGDEVSSVMSLGQMAEIVFLALLPWFLNRLGMKWVLAVGMLAWGVRYALFALGTPYELVVLGILLHGICFDFFFAAGFIHVDNKTPRDIRASAQALFSFLTYGAGMYLGGELSGRVAEWAKGGTDVIDWTRFWSVPSIGVFASLAVFVLFFRERPATAVAPAGPASPSSVTPETV
jgi:nucleoside transporter